MRSCSEFRPVALRNFEPPGAARTARSRRGGARMAGDGAVGSTRLDRLFSLLEVGSNTLTKRTAAQQIGDVQKYHPHELQNLLFRLRPYLLHKNWETRTAAGVAIDAIIANVEQFNPDWSAAGTATEADGAAFKTALRFSDFNLLEIMQKGQPLLASGGTEFDDGDDMKSLDPKARIEIQKKRLLKRIGFIEKVDEDLENIFKDEDFEVVQPSASAADTSRSSAVTVMSSMENISSRERNRLKRLEKKQAKQRGAPKPAASSTLKEHTPQTVVGDAVTDPTAAVNYRVEWPFTAFCEQLLHDVFDRVWEVRHGAGIGIRTILQSHGRCSGMSVLYASSDDDLAVQHEEWVNDCAIRLLCVQALDKFSDYSSGQAVCPVRETCSQALGVLMQHASDGTVRAVRECLLQLIMREEWEPRHSGYLGLKYVLAVRQDLVLEYLDTVLPAMIRGLSDESDDVRAIVSESLLPIHKEIVVNAPARLPDLLSALWGGLLFFDELSSSTASLLKVISALYSHSEVFQCEMQCGLDVYIPRIFPSLVHSSVSVRTTAVEALQRIATAAFNHPHSWLQFDLLCTWLRVQFQVLLVEENDIVIERSFTLWRTLLDIASNVSVGILDSGFIEPLCRLASAGPHENLSPNLLIDLSLYTQSDGERPAKRPKTGSGDGPQIKGSTSMVLRGARGIAILLPFLANDEARNAVVALLQELRAYSRICGTAVFTDVAFKPSLPLLIANLGSLDDAPANFAEFSYHRSRLEALARDLAQSTGLVVNLDTITPEIALQIATSAPVGNNQRASQLQQAVLASKGRLDTESRALVNTIRALAAAALITADYFPEKLSPLINPLLRGVEKQRQEQLQRRSATALGILVHKCCTRGVMIQKLLAKLIPMATIGRTEVTLTNERDIELRGAQAVLEALCASAGDDLFESLPVIWQRAQTVLQAFKQALSAHVQTAPSWLDDATQDSIFRELMIIKHLLTFVKAENPRSRVLSLLPLVCCCLEYPSESIRNQAASCVTDFCHADVVLTLEYVIDNVLPNFNRPDADQLRFASMLALHSILTEIGVHATPYLAFLVRPVLARTTDPCPEVRDLASMTFAAAVRLIPLESGVPNPPGMSAELAHKRIEERAFISQIVDGSKIPDYVVRVPIKATLRRYQQEGVNWLAFMQQFNLHGILCDDMGLGKTLQTVCILASSVRTNRDSGLESLPSLVICPSTLVRHWPAEIEKFCDPGDLSGICYDGTASERAEVRRGLMDTVKDNVLVMSYNTWRSDMAHFEHVNWNYCVLDEGHIIKNPKSKITESVKRVRARHRLVLSGTPIQNNVVDLWSIFDFLMPGYLGTYTYFNAHFAKPISLGGSAKASDRDQEASIKALESLHKQVLPFLLRRVKGQVLDDLPEKIIQDYYCDMSPLQVELYESFSRSTAVEEAQQDLSYDTTKQSGEAGAQHVFQVLQYLRKLVTHPALVLNPSHPDYENVMQELAASKRSLRDIDIAPKFLALQQLLLDCGIGTTTDSTTGMAVSQHRVLLFAQLKSVLDLVQKDLFERHMPTVTFARLDGSMSSKDRFEVVKKFNEDPSIDVLLLTTRIGGLGLNLTGADTVIFMEHDWNPSNDLQAMDRAHRIGQTKVVNVYRLLTRNTLEEKIMRLQKWKQSIADTVITEDNTSLRSMDTGQVLDLMKISSERMAPATRAAAPSAGAAEQLDAFGNIPSGKKTGLKAMLDGLQELWDESQYEEEYSINQFLSKLR
ncbi:unnamed protein product (mitochondrion) [Plasmodiophora brassicae]|uniref:Uncharacterized protein n=1 Tax=Plasmodiophora brassicae TaxID=37360 RepID=A0A3P3Y2V1_PLABS|nr:unnamed protein product [Plasmodiophora brassicae]